MHLLSISTEGRVAAVEMTAGVDERVEGELGATDYLAVTLHHGAGAEAILLMRGRTRGPRNDLAERLIVAGGAAAREVRGPAVLLDCAGGGFSTPRDTLFDVLEHAVHAGVESS